jgi:hypothetical protein
LIGRRVLWRPLPLDEELELDGERWRVCALLGAMATLAHLRRVD